MESGERANGSAPKSSSAKASGEPAGSCAETVHTVAKKGAPPPVALDSAATLSIHAAIGPSIARSSFPR